LTSNNRSLPTLQRDVPYSSSFSVTRQRVPWEAKGLFFRRHIPADDTLVMPKSARSVSYHDVGVVVGGIDTTRPQTWDGTICWSIVLIMRPEGKSPRAVADEVSVIVRNTEIVQLLLPSGQPQRCDRHALMGV